jgi:hypothetical protein
VPYRRCALRTDHEHAQGHKHLGWQSRLVPCVSDLALKYNLKRRTLACYGHEDNAVLSRSVTRSQFLDKFDIVSVSTCADVMNQAFENVSLQMRYNLDLRMYRVGL